jgi:hypothetical protein
MVMALCSTRYGWGWKNIIEEAHRRRRALSSVARLFVKM